MGPDIALVCWIAVRTPVNHECFVKLLNISDLKNVLDMIESRPSGVCIVLSELVNCYWANRQAVFEAW